MENCHISHILSIMRCIRFSFFSFPQRIPLTSPLSIHKYYQYKNHTISRTLLIHSELRKEKMITNLFFPTSPAPFTFFPFPFVVVSFCYFHLLFFVLPFITHTLYRAESRDKKWKGDISFFYSILTPLHIPSLCPLNEVITVRICPLWAKIDPWWKWWTRIEGLSKREKGEKWQQKEYERASKSFEMTVWWSQNYIEFRFCVSK